jgi:hypothetical protein
MNEQDVNKRANTTALAAGLGVLLAVSGAVGSVLAPGAVAAEVSLTTVIPGGFEAAGSLRYNEQLNRYEMEILREGGWVYLYEIKLDGTVELVERHR